MVTGDHVRTAISVAHQCSILPVGRPVLMVDAAAAGRPIDSSPVALSVVYPDGSVNHTVSRTTVLSQVSLSLQCMLVQHNLYDDVCCLCEVQTPPGVCPVISAQQ
jgi:magnesium-transporting ATPase (P-type)